MRIVPGLVLASVIAASASVAVTAPASAREGSPPVRSAVHLDVRGGGARPPSAGYRSSFQRLATPSRTIRAEASRAPSTTVSAPTSVEAFDGIPQLGGFEPSDTTGALGTSYVLTAVNTHYALWNLDGTPALPPTSLDALTRADDALEIYDPKVIYDPYADAFVLVHLAQRDTPHRSLIVITTIPDATATDRSTWCVTPIAGDQVGGDVETWADYPGLGYDEKRVTITTNEFTYPTRTARFVDAQALTFRTSTLTDCSVGLRGKVFAGRRTQNPDGSQAFTLQPAQSAGPASGQVLLSFEQRGKRSSITIFRIRKTRKGLRITRGTVRTGRVAPPPPGTQGGGSQTDPDTFWDTGDTRLINAFYDGDLHRVYTAHALARNLKPDTVTGGYQESAVRWYELDLSGGPTAWSRTRWGIVGVPEADSGWPSVATDGSGNLFVTFSRASEPLGEFLSAWSAEIPPGSTTASLTELVPGTTIHDAIKGVERWGDFTAIGRDPADPSRIAMINQIAVPGAWQQTVNVVTSAGG